METGYIKLHRKILDWEWYDDSNTFRLFIYFLLKANHTNKLWRGIEIKKGSFITSIDTMSKDLGISVMSVRTAINKLLLTNEITKSSTSKYTIITVNNYNEYQGVTNEATNEQQTNNKQVTTTKNDKNDKNEKEIYYCPEENKLKNLDIDFFKNMFPELNIEFEINSMNIWLEENPKKRKKKYKTFIINWLKRCMENKNNKKSNNNNNSNDNFHLIEKIISEGKYRSESQLHLLPELEAEFVRSLPCGFNTINEVSGNEFEYNKIKKQYKNFIKEKM